MALRYFNHPEYKDPVLTYKYDTNLGHITCESCNEHWCNHIKAAVVHGWDQEAIWQLASLESELFLQIPMFPTYNIWTQVSLLAMEGPVPRLEVVWYFRGSYRTICFINPGEGRSVIRSSLVEYMWADQTRTKECKARHHSFAAQQKWEADMKGNRRHAQCWSVYITDYCLVCKAGSDPSPDLIPPKQGTGVFNG